MGIQSATSARRRGRPLRRFPAARSRPRLCLLAPLPTGYRYVSHPHVERRAGAAQILSCIVLIDVTRSGWATEGVIHPEDAFTTDDMRAHFFSHSSHPGTSGDRDFTNHTCFIPASSCVQFPGASTSRPMPIYEPDVVLIHSALWCIRTSQRGMSSVRPLVREPKPDEVKERGQEICQCVTVWTLVSEPEEGTYLFH